MISQQKKQEIIFFKNKKPYIQGRLNYYRKIQNFHYERPIGGIIYYDSEEVAKMMKENSTHNNY